MKTTHRLFLYGLAMALIAGTTLAGCSSGGGQPAAARVSEYDLHAAPADPASPFRFEPTDAASGGWKVTGPAGSVWTSNPKDSASIDPANPVEQAAASPFTIAYWDGNATQTTNPVAAGAETKVRTIGDGTAVDYRFHQPVDLEISFEFRSTKNGLSIRIPEERLKEYGQTKLVSVSIAPFLDAATPKDDGYLLIPDGSGALIRFSADHPKVTGEYRAEVYGRDPSLSMLRKTTSVEQPIAPVFGTVRQGKAVLGMVTEGGAQTVIHAAPAGFQSPYYHAWPEIVYRQTDTITIQKGGTQNAEMTVLGPLNAHFDASVSYTFLNGDQASYVGMAQAFRGILTDYYGMAKMAVPEAPIYIQVLGGVKRKTALFSQYETMTTFDQVGSLADQLQAAGIGKMDISLLGWETGGGYATSPAGKKAASKLGGDAGLKKLKADLAARNIPLRIEKDFIQAFSDKGLSVKNAGMYGLNRDYVKLNQWNLVTLKPEGATWNLIRPDWSIQHALGGFLSYLRKEEADGVYLRSLGSMLPSDFNKDRYISRSQMQGDYQSILKQIKQQAARVTVDYGNLYALPYADHISNFPLEQSYFSGVDETVPFFPIALHGLVTYSGAARNLQSDSLKSFLRGIEYGALPEYVLSVNDIPLDNTPYEQIYSSQATAWLGQIASEYKQISEGFAKLAGESIVDHKPLDGKQQAFVTVYESGTEVVVNYGGHPVMYRGVQVPADGFRVIPGKGV